MGWDQGKNDEERTQTVTVIDVPVSEDPIVKMMKRVQETSPLFAVVKVPGRQADIRITLPRNATAKDLIAELLEGYTQELKNKDVSKLIWKGKVLLGSELLRHHVNALHEVQLYALLHDKVPSSVDLEVYFSVDNLSIAVSPDGNLLEELLPESVSLNCFPVSFPTNYKIEKVKRYVKSQLRMWTDGKGVRLYTGSGEHMEDGKRLKDYRTVLNDKSKAVYFIPEPVQANSANAFEIISNSVDRSDSIVDGNSSSKSADVLRITDTTPPMHSSFLRAAQQYPSIFRELPDDVISELSRASRNLPDNFQIEIESDAGVYDDSSSNSAEASLSSTEAKYHVPHHSMIRTGTGLRDHRRQPVSLNLKGSEKVMKHIVDSLFKADKNNMASSPRIIKSKFDLDVVCCKILNLLLKSRQQNRVSTRVTRESSSFRSGLKGGFFRKKESNTDSKQMRDAETVKKPISDSGKRLKKAFSSGSMNMKRSLNAQSMNCKCNPNPEDRINSVMVRSAAQNNARVRLADSQLRADSDIALAREQKEELRLPTRKRTKRSKCDMCQRKVEFMLMSCRCGSTFCMEHRLPEVHQCKFDFKTSGKEIIKASNPLVAAPKINNKL